MITRIELENLRGVVARVVVDLRPITFLFGANSAGKSTLTQALHYALEILRHHNLDPDRTSRGGGTIDLGGFYSLVHAHDLERRIKMLFEFDVDGGLPDYTAGISDLMPVAPGVPGGNLEDADLADRVLSAWVQLEVGWSRALNAPHVFAFELGLNGGPREHPTVRIEAGPGKSQTATLVLRTNDAVWGGAIESGDRSTLEHLVRDAGFDVIEGQVALPIFGQRSALPTWGRPLRLWAADDMQPVTAPLIEVRRLASRLVIGLGETLTELLESLLYIGPLRAVPPRNYRPPLTVDKSRWADGLGAWDALHHGGRSLTERVSAWLERLGTGYTLDLQDVVELDATAADSLSMLIEDLLDSQGALDAPRLHQEDADSSRFDVARSRARLWADALAKLQRASHRQQLRLLDDKTGVPLGAADVGVGISQVLPVIVAALYAPGGRAGSVVVIEQPELHVHPRLQVALADLFIEQTTGPNVSRQFLLETHSEHILLRVLRRIRESARGGRQSDSGTSDILSPERVSVIYVQRTSEGLTAFSHLRVDSSGEFLDVWPEGFFEERDPELFG